MIYFKFSYLDGLSVGCSGPEALSAMFSFSLRNNLSKNVCVTLPDF